MPSPRRRTDQAARPVAAPPVMVINGWKIYAHPLFIDQFEELLHEVEQLRAADPAGYREKKKTKLLAAIQKMAFEVIPQNPAHQMFLQGNTLGLPYRHWYRGKFFDGRYRLFFRFSSNAKAIVLAWVNDAETLRTYGSRTDAYTVFKAMLARSPNDWEALLKEAEAEVPRSTKLLGRSQGPRFSSPH